VQALVVGLNIKNAPVEILETLSIHHSVNTHCLKDLMALAGLQGAVILSTCNRLELYTVTENPEQGTAAMRAFLADQDETSDPKRAKELQGYLYDYSGREAIRHLFRVVSGLDSLVLGETEIFGQVARSYESARKAGATCKILNVWFQRALHVGKEARVKAGLDKYHTSVGRIAVDLAQQELGDLKGRQILILGAGEMSELTMRHLVEKAAFLAMVSNRSLSKARALADEYGFDACSLDELPQHLEYADLVFSATSSKNYLVTFDMLKDIMVRRRQRPIMFVDMAVPRDIDPRVAELDGVRYFDIRQLRAVSDRNLSQREQAATLVEAIIEERVEDFLDWIASLETMQICSRSA